MTKYFFIMFLSICSFILPVIAQETNRNKRAHNDSTAKFGFPNKLSGNNLFDSLSNLKKTPGFRNGDIYHNLEHDIFSLRCNCLNFSTDYSLLNSKLWSFKKNITSYLKLIYEEIPNYDFRVVGEYLGIAKKIFVIILAILSL